MLWPCFMGRVDFRYRRASCPTDAPTATALGKRRAVSACPLPRSLTTAPVYGLVVFSVYGEADGRHARGNQSPRSSRRGDSPANRNYPPIANTDAERRRLLQTENMRDLIVTVSL